MAWSVRYWSESGSVTWTRNKGLPLSPIEEQSVCTAKSKPQLVPISRAWTLPTSSTLPRAPTTAASPRPIRLHRSASAECWLRRLPHAVHVERGVIGRVASWHTSSICLPPLPIKLWSRPVSTVCHCCLPAYLPVGTALGLALAGQWLLPGALCRGSNGRAPGSKQFLG